MLNDQLVQQWQNSQVLLIGGSAGSFKFIFSLIRSFPHDLNKTVIIVIHRKKNFLSEMESLFAENSRLMMREISDKEKIAVNAVYIAPANYHTLIEDNGYFSLDVSEAVWYSKPSIDVTFESAAGAYGKKCTALLLSGANQDGAQGLLMLRNCGALTIAQHPGDADMAEMPQAAIDIGAAQYILRDQEIIQLLQSL